MDKQGGFHLGFIPAWNLFTPWGLSAGLVFYIASIAEANRCPFDLPEGESEIVAGHMTEYSGFKYALFFMGEYLGLFAISGLGITLFLGGWQAPLPGLGFVPSWIWFFAKLAVVILSFLWIRGTFPRVRIDQLMRFAWLCMMPMALLTLPAAAIWHFTGRGLSGLGGHRSAAADSLGHPHRDLQPPPGSGHPDLSLCGFIGLIGPIRTYRQMIPLLILSPLILLAALGAVWKARPVHAALLLALALALTAVLYLTIGADFIGLVQFMVYVGAVAVLIVFSLLITRPGDEAEELARRPRSLVTGLACTLPVLGGAALFGFARWTPRIRSREAPSFSVEQLGIALFTTHAPAVLAVAVLLTAVMIGAALFARDPGKKPQTPSDP